MPDVDVGKNNNKMVSKSASRNRRSILGRFILQSICPKMLIRNL